MLDASIVKSTLVQLGFEPKKRPVPSLPTPQPLQPQQQELSVRYKGKGNELLRAARYKEAVACFSQAIAINPWNAALYNNRAAAHLFLEDNVSAAADCEIAIALDPAHYRALCNLGTAYLGLGKFRDAIEYGFLWALDLQPNNEDVRCGIDQALLKLGVTK
jgi:Flp pilus assembly protein TadD